jgi:hypothetical protein
MRELRRKDAVGRLWFGILFPRPALPSHLTRQGRWKKGRRGGIEGKCRVWRLGGIRLRGLQPDSDNSLQSMSMVTHHLNTLGLRVFIGKMKIIIARLLP